MVTPRFLILLCLLILIPSYSSAFDTKRSEAVPFQFQHEQSFREQGKSAGDTLLTEAYTLQSQQSETTLQSDKKEESVTSYSSNPVATKAVDRNISLFTERIKERFSLWLQRSGKYLEMMKDILKGKNIPEDIAFLPLIESGFNPSAYSVARAVGPWQFIASTAKKYGLKMDWWRDERKDPVKSTEAAANYLKDLYEMFGSWNLAMAAYNAGEGKIIKALNRSKKDDYWALLNTKYIKNETKEYVPRFIAAKLIASNPGDYGFVDLNYHPPFEFDLVVLDKPIDLDIAAKCAETTLDTIRELNPELRRWSTPPNVSPYPLRILYGKKDVFFDNLSKVPEVERFSISEYVVRKGDTIKKISNKVGIPVSVIAELNSYYGEMKQLKTGEKIFVPPKEKLFMDLDDKVGKKKVSLKNRRAKDKRQTVRKIVITSLSKKQPYLND